MMLGSQFMRTTQARLAAALGDEWLVARGYQLEPPAGKGLCTIMLTDVVGANEDLDEGSGTGIYSAIVVLQAKRSTHTEERMWAGFDPVLAVMEDLQWVFEEAGLDLDSDDNGEKHYALGMRYRISSVDAAQILPQESP